MLFVKFFYIIGVGLVIFYKDIYILSKFLYILFKRHSLGSHHESFIPGLESVVFSGHDQKHDYNSYDKDIGYYEQYTQIEIPQTYLRK